MKVVHLISGGETGGSKNHLISLLSQFEKEEVSLIVMQEGSLYNEARQNGIDVHLFHQTSRYDFSIISKLKAFIEKGQFDLLHTHGPRANLFGYIIKKGLKFPWITTIHSDPKLDFIKGGIKGRAFTLINLWIIKRINHFFAVSDRFKDNLIELGVNSSKITTIYNGIDFTAQQETGLTREQLGLNKDDFVVAMVARLHPIKGHKEVFQALNQLRDPSIKLLLIGEGPERQSLKNQVKQLDLENQVQFLGFRKDVPSIYKVSDIGLLASYSESFPLALLEAAREKKTVISTDVGGVQHLVKDYGWIVPPQNAHALANTFKEAKGKKVTNELANLGQKLYHHAATTYSLDQLAHSIKENYKKIIKK